MAPPIRSATRPSRLYRSTERIPGAGCARTCGHCPVPPGWRSLGCVYGGWVPHATRMRRARVIEDEPRFLLSTYSPLVARNSDGEKLENFDFQFNFSIARQIASEMEGKVSSREGWIIAGNWNGGGFFLKGILFVLALWYFINDRLEMCGNETQRPLI